MSESTGMHEGLSPEETMEKLLAATKEIKRINAAYKEIQELHADPVLRDRDPGSHHTAWLVDVGAWHTFAISAWREELSELFKSARFHLADPTDLDNTVEVQAISYDEGKDSLVGLMSGEHPAYINFSVNDILLPER